MLLVPVKNDVIVIYLMLPYAPQACLRGRHISTLKRFVVERSFGESARLRMSGTQNLLIACIQKRGGLNW